MVQGLRRETIETDEGVMSYYTRMINSEKQHTLVFVHGAMETGLIFEELASRLPDVNVVLLDLPQHGYSRGIAKESVEGYTDSVIKVINKLEGEKKITGSITLIGHSMGGSISLEATHRNLFGLKNIIMISSSFKWDNIPTVVSQMVTDLNVTKGLVESEFTSSATPEDKDFLEKNFNKYIIDDAAVRVNDFNAVLKYNSETSLKDVNIPVLAISGDKDHLALAENQVTMLREIPKCYLKLLANQGHNAVMTPSAVEEIAESIKSILNTVTEGC